METKKLLNTVLLITIEDKKKQISNFIQIWQFQTIINRALTLSDLEDPFKLFNFY